MTQSLRTKDGPGRSVDETIRENSPRTPSSNWAWFLSSIGTLLSQRTTLPLIDELEQGIDEATLTNFLSISHSMHCCFINAAEALLPQFTQLMLKWSCLPGVTPATISIAGTSSLGFSGEVIAQGRLSPSNSLAVSISTTPILEILLRERDPNGFTNLTGVLFDSLSDLTKASARGCFHQGGIYTRIPPVAILDASMHCLSESGRLNFQAGVEHLTIPDFNLLPLVI